MLTQLLKGSRAKKLLELGLNANPSYGFYRQLRPEEVLARVDWVIENGFLDIDYAWRLPVLVFTEIGWEIERETYADELLTTLAHMAGDGSVGYDMRFLKDRNREVILLLLDKIEASGNRAFIPLLRAWEKIDYRKVSERIRRVFRHLEQPSQ